jgi:hypothetical protein
MARERKVPITDIRLKEKDVKALRKGYRIFKMANKHRHCIYVANKDRKKEREIAKLKERIRELEAKPKTQKTPVL